MDGIKYANIYLQKSAQLLVKKNECGYNIRERKRKPMGLFL